MAVCAAMVLILGPVVLGPLVTLALRQRALAGRLRRVALTDSLTGLPNRRAFFAAARRWLRRGGRDFGVLMIDLDRFKAISDRWGHEAGDLALRARRGGDGGGAGPRGAGGLAAGATRRGGVRGALGRRGRRGPVPRRRGDLPQPQDDALSPRRRGLSSHGERRGLARASGGGGRPARRRRPRGLPSQGRRARPLGGRVGCGPPAQRPRLRRWARR
jgi:hypothetical protein